MTSENFQRQRKVNQATIVHGSTMQRWQRNQLVKIQNEAGDWIQDEVSIK